MTVHELSLSRGSRWRRRGRWTGLRPFAFAASTTMFLLFLAACEAPSADGASSTVHAGECAGLGEDVPDDLACTGLYSDVVAKAVAPSVRAYAPAVSFWSDGLDKARFIMLPEGASIDAANVDDWRFPLGTKVWKELARGSRKIETRFFWKVRDDRWLQAAYVWSEDGARAVRAEGDITVDGAPYHVPKNSECNECHRGRVDKLLGFEAISLAQPGATGLTLETLTTEGRIAPPPARTSVTLPDPAFGVLHVNCGVTCHNGTSTASATSTGLRLRLTMGDVAMKPVNEWDAFKTSVGVEATTPSWSGETRVKAGAPEESLIARVMKTRGEGQMPPLATTTIDTEGVTAVESWIRAMPHAPVSTSWRLNGH